MLSSLSNRIFLASALLAVLSIGTALLPGQRRRDAAGRGRARGEPGRGRRAGHAVPVAVLHRAAARGAHRRRRAGAQGRGRHEPRRDGGAAPAGYLEAVQADLLDRHQPHGRRAGRARRARACRRRSSPDQRIVKAALAGRSAVDVWSQGSGLLQVGVGADLHRPGAARGARHADRRPAPRSAAGDRIKTITRSDVVFVDGGKPRGSTLPADVTAALLAVPDDGRVLRATVNGEEYEAVRRRLVIETPGTLRSARRSRTPAGRWPSSPGRGPRTWRSCATCTRRSARRPRWRCWSRRSSASRSPAR